MTGPTGKMLNTSVIIIPEINYAFEIVDVSAKNGEYITFSIKEKEEAGRMSYILTVQNQRKAKGRYVDTIFLKTNSDYRPIIEIYVIGYIT